MTDDLSNLVTGVALAVSLGFMFATVAITGWVIMRAARYEPGAMLVVILGILAVVGIMAALADPDQAGDFVTLSATAIGALAAALTSWRLARNGKSAQEPPQDAQDGPGSAIEPETPQDTGGPENGD